MTTQVIQNLPAWDQVVSDFGNLLNISETAEFLQIKPYKLREYVKRGHFTGKYLITGVTIQQQAPLEKKNCQCKYFFIENSLSEVQIELNEIEAGSRYKNVIPDHHFAMALGISTEELLEQIKTCVWDECVIGATRFSCTTGREVYQFKRDALDEIPYRGLARVAKVVGVDYTTLKGYAIKGWITQPEHLKGTNLYDIEAVRKKIPQIQLEQLQNLRKYYKDSVLPWNVISEVQRNLINNYVEDRVRGLKIVWEDKKFAYKKIRNSEENINRYRQELARGFYRVICGRMGIDVVQKKTDDSNIALRYLTDEELQNFKPEIFRIEDFDLNEEDVRHMTKGLSEFTVYERGRFYRPFLYWLLMKAERKFSVWRINQEQALQYWPIRSNLLSAIYYYPEDKIKPRVKRGKVFLSRSQLIQVFNAILSQPRKKDKLKKAVMWMVGCFVGIRPQEMCKLRIEHFQLNSEGFILKDNYGFGRLFLPAECSKGGYSPSHETHGTLIVPQLVDLLNAFIGKLYKYQSKRSCGFLFRVRNTLPETPANPASFAWINKFKWELEFLDDKDIKPFQFKSSRHSLNELINTTYISYDPSLNIWKQRAGELQMRHNIMGEGIGTTVGERHYRNEITFENYFKVIHETLNFPWDLEELQRWEKEKGYTHNMNSYLPSISAQIDDEMLDCDVISSVQAIARVDTVSFNEHNLTEEQEELNSEKVSEYNQLYSDYQKLLSIKPRNMSPSKRRELLSEYRLQLYKLNSLGNKEER